MVDRFGVEAISPTGEKKASLERFDGVTALADSFRSILTTKEPISQCSRR